MLSFTVIGTPAPQPRLREVSAMLAGATRGGGGVMMRPILFRPEMVRAILAGDKTQMRRPKKDKSGPGCNCPYGEVGDYLWVRETFALESCRDVGWYDPPFTDGRPLKIVEDDGWGRYWLQPHYRATDATPELEIGTGEPGVRWKASIHMPRWASRITLEITNIHVERVQEIREKDARSEGVTPNHWADLQPDGAPRPGESIAHRAVFHELWDHIHANDGSDWAANPWVWVIEFRKLAPSEHSAPEMSPTGGAGEVKL